MIINENKRWLGDDGLIVSRYFDVKNFRNQTVDNWNSGLDSQKSDWNFAYSMSKLKLNHTGSNTHCF